LRHCTVYCMGSSPLGSKALLEISSGGAGAGVGGAAVSAGAATVSAGGGDVGVGGSGVAVGSTEVGAGSSGAAVGGGPPPQPLVASAIRVAQRNSGTSVFIFSPSDLLLPQEPFIFRVRSRRIAQGVASGFLLVQQFFYSGAPFDGLADGSPHGFVVVDGYAATVGR